MDYIESLIISYRQRGLLVDTNLLLLYIVGKYDPERIPKFKRTMSFTIEEFELLSRFLDLFEKLVTTPNVMTEVSNHLRQLPEYLRSSFFNDFAARLPSFEEHYRSSAVLASSPVFSRFGLTDCAIVDLVKESHLVLTDDFPLAGYLQSQQIDVIKFNHIRTLGWVV